MTKVKKSGKYSQESSSSSDSSLSSDEETDACDLKPIKDYLSNRRELARQLFKSVKTEKIRMMLPQVLKKMDLSELEEWCASELSGMSKKRILSILNGQPMLESSDTSESDDSGPSLEIISDTEEWLTDDEVIKNEDGTPATLRKTKVKKDKTKTKIKSQNNKKNEADKGKAKSKTIQKEKTAEKQKEVKVKKEGEKEANKGKEGDSLLDLLELEMRARAIRALIRKEEDIIPDTTTNRNASTSSTSGAGNQNKIMQDELAAKENCRKQLEKIITSKQITTGDDEDVVLVVQPTPTIELLSSDSESEGHSQRTNNKRVVGTENVHSNTEENTANTSKQVAEQSSAMLNKVPSKGTEKSVQNANIDSGNDNCNTTAQEDRHSEKRKLKNSSEKNRKRSHSSKKVKDDIAGHSEAIADVTDTNIDKLTSTTASTVSEGILTKEESKRLLIDDSENEKIRKVPCESSNTRTTSCGVSQEDERSADLGEIIDLDDYPDDMDDMDTCEAGKSDRLQSEDMKTKSKGNAQKLSTTETWASRYYQTDDVQNVIKESKIQSEIRKRLRERQRLSKLNNSPNANPSTSTADSPSEKLEPKPTGSVEEYLALKRIQLNPSASNSTNVFAKKDLPTESCSSSGSQVNENIAESTVGKSDISDVSAVSNNSESQSSSIRSEEKEAISTASIGICPGEG